MINAQRHTLFGAEYGISRPGQVNLERGASSDLEAALARADMRGAGVVRHRMVDTRPSRTPQGHAGVAG